MAPTKGTLRSAVKLNTKSAYRSFSHNPPSHITHTHTGVKMMAASRQKPYRKAKSVVVATPACVISQRAKTNITHTSEVMHITLKCKKRSVKYSERPQPAMAPTSRRALRRSGHSRPVITLMHFVGENIFGNYGEGELNQHDSPGGRTKLNPSQCCQIDAVSTFWLSGSVADPSAKAITSPGRNSAHGTGNPNCPREIYLRGHVEYNEREYNPTETFCWPMDVMLGLKGANPMCP